MPERLLTGKRVVGAKETKKALEAGEAEVVFLARDAATRLTGPLAELCREKDVEAIFVESMKELGRYCGIDVGSATAALLKSK